jgi:hypothetical protein
MTIDIKVDVLFPGIMNIPLVPISSIKTFEGIKVAPFDLVLLLKLQAWKDHQLSLEAYKRQKQWDDKRDLERLLPLAVQRGMRIAEGPYFSRIFLDEAERKARDFERTSPATRGDWNTVGLRSDRQEPFGTMDSTLSFSSNSGNTPVSTLKMAPSLKSKPMILKSSETSRSSSSKQTESSIFTAPKPPRLPRSLRSPYAPLVPTLFDSKPKASPLGLASPLSKQKSAASSQTKPTVSPLIKMNPSVPPIKQKQVISPLLSREPTISPMPIQKKPKALEPIIGQPVAARRPNPTSLQSLLLGLNLSDR